MFELRNNLCRIWDQEWTKYGKIRVLVLGSIPGLISNKKLFYYSSGRQIIWDLLSDVLNEDFKTSLDSKDYLSIVKKLSSHGVALSDIYSYADKTVEDSNDSSLIKESLIRNENLINFLESDDLTFIVFNGKYKRKFINAFENDFDSEKIKLIELPSLSGANTHMSISEKRNEWIETLKDIVSTDSK